MKRGLVVLGLLPCLLLVSCDEMWVLTPPEAPAPASLPMDTGSGDEVLEPGDVPAPLEGEPAAGSGALTQERINAGGVLEIGSPGAMELALYTNHACAYCNEFTREYLPRLQQDFVQKGLLRISMHVVPFQKYPNSSVEAAGLYCASKRGKGLPMHLTLLDLKTRTRDAVVAAGKDYGITAPDMRACLDDQLTRDAVAADQALSAAGGVTLVPAFRMNGELKTGLPAYADLRGWIESGLTR